MMTALCHWLMPEVVYSVAIMKIHMVHYAMFEIAIISRSIVHVHAKPTRTYGTSTHFAMVAKHCLVLLAFFDALKLKISLGFLNTINMSITICLAIWASHNSNTWVWQRISSTTFLPPISQPILVPQCFH